MADTWIGGTDMFGMKRIKELESDLKNTNALVLKLMGRLLEKDQEVKELSNRIAKLETNSTTNGTKKVDLPNVGNENKGGRGFASRFFDRDYPEVNPNWYLGDENGGK